jgi:protein SCO1/2
MVKSTSEILISNQFLSPLLKASVMASLALAVTFFNPQTVQAAQLVQAAAPTGGDFTLIGTANKSVSLKDFRGKLVLLYFGYTTCPDICPTNLSNLAEAMSRLTEKERASIQVAMITVDPERDTQDKLDVYLPYFHPEFIGLTGQPNAIQRIAHQYGAVYQKAPLADTSLGYAVDHSAFTYLIDQKGKLITQLPHATTAEAFVAAIRQQLK